MTKSDSSLGLFFPRVDSAKEGSAGALQFGSGHEPWMVFLPSLPPALPVSKESVFHLTSCFFAMIQPNDSQIPWEWPEDDAMCGAGNGHMVYHNGARPWPWAVVLEHCCSSRWQLGHLRGGPPGVYVRPEHHQDSSFWNVQHIQRGLWCLPPCPRPSFPSLPRHTHRPPSVRALRAETAWSQGTTYWWKDPSRRAGLWNLPHPGLCCNLHHSFRAPLSRYVEKLQLAENKWHFHHHGLGRKKI